jgi:hypothetical protein
MQIGVPGLIVCTPGPIRLCEALRSEGAAKLRANVDWELSRPIAVRGSNHSTFFLGQFPFGYQVSLRTGPQGTIGTAAAAPKTWSKNQVRFGRVGQYLLAA